MIPETNDVRERLQEAMRTLESIIPVGTGISLFCYPLGGKSGRIEYIANARREDVVKMLVGWIAKTDGGRYGKHLPDELMPPPEIKL